MAIDRGPWNALVDDDGSNLVGSIWNKNAIKTVLLDPIDAMGSGTSGSAFVEIVNTDVGTVNDWAPAGFPTAAPALIIWAGVSNTTITGLAAGYQGQVVVLRNMSSTAALFLPNSHVGSLVANRFDCPVTSAAVPLGRYGYAHLIYSGGVWRIIANEQGGWITPPYSATDYFASAGLTWTVTAGNVSLCSYRLTGKSLSWHLSVANTTVAGSGVFLQRYLPGGFTASGQFPGWCDAYQGATVGGIFELSGAPTVIGFLKDAIGTAWGPATLHIKAFGICEVT